MFEIVNLHPMPTTEVMVGLTTALLALNGSATRGIVPPKKAESPTTKAALPPREPTFSYFNIRHSFKKLPNAFAEPYREMLALKTFADGWDGEGSKQIANDSVNAALAFLALLPSDVPPPEASAASDGTVDWYWRKGSKAATVTFYADRKAAYFALTDAGGVKDAFRLVDKIPAPLIESLRQL
jgi:hypothetical protein